MKIPQPPEHAASLKRSPPRGACGLHRRLSSETLQLPDPTLEHLAVMREDMLDKSRGSFPVENR